MRIVQVGTGVRGAKWAQVVRELAETTMVGYVSRRMDVLQERVRKFGDEGVPCFVDLAQALDETRPDAVILVTPPEGHHEQIMAAFERNIPMLAEKPLTEDLDEAVELVQEAEKRHLQLMVGMNFRYLPSHQEIKRILAERELGELSFAHFTYLRQRDGNRADLNKYPLTMNQPMLLEQSVHHLDLMRYCYGRDVESVFARTWNPPWSTYQHDSNVSLLLKFEGEVHVTYLGTWTAAWNELNFRWRIDCSGGVLVQKKQFSDLHKVKFEPELGLTGANFKDSAEPLMPVDVVEARAFIDDTRLMLSRFIEAVSEGKPVETSAKDHLRTLSLVFACIESSETGQEVFLSDFYQQNGVPV